MKNKILVIDDEVEILNVYERILIPQDEIDVSSLDFLDPEESFSTDVNLFEQEYEVIKASSGQEGVEQAKLHPDAKIAFIDMRMPPGINGAETARLIREINSKIEIVIVTAYSDINLKEIVQIVGKPEKLLYLRKPFASEEIEQLSLNLVTKYNSERIKEKFLGNVSHEMKTPLSVISGYTSILEDVIEDSEQLEYTSAISNSSKQLEELINSLLHLTEIESLDSVECSNSAKLSTVFETLKNNLFVYSHRYPEVIHRFNIQTEDVNIKGRNQDLIYAIGNVIDNAFKFTKKGEVVIDVTKEEENICITIKDNGIGIPSDLLGHVYDKFYRIENTVHTDIGFGLGLSNSRDIIQKVGGKISIESQENSGTTVQLQIPVVGGSS